MWSQISNLVVSLVHWGFLEMISCVTLVLYMNLLVNDPVVLDKYHVPVLVTKSSDHGHFERNIRAISGIHLIDHFDGICPEMVSATNLSSLDQQPYKRMKLKPTL